jgi:sRNA-binding regulator protein Hfq
MTAAAAEETIAQGDQRVWQELLQELAADASIGFSVYLVNGIKLQFKRIVAFDNICFKALDPNGVVQCIMRQAVSTLVPAVAKSQR